MHALVTGGGGGLGPAVVRALVAEGYDVTIHYRTAAAAAAELAAAARAQGRRAVALEADLTRPEAVGQLVQEAHSRHGSLEVLVHGVGPFNFQRRPLAEQTLAQWERLIAGNLSSTFFLLQHAVPIMRNQRYGRIIAFGCAGADHAAPWPGHAAYAAAKAGLVALIKTVAAEEVASGITANVVLPGIIDRQHKQAHIAQVSGLQDRWQGSRRPGAGEDIARVVAFLAGPQSDYLTGAAIAVDGGLIA